MTLSKRFNLISMMLLLLSFSLGCAKKRTNVRTEAQATSGVRENPGVSSGAASVVSDTGKKQADAVAAANGITVDWVTTDELLK